ncbi:MAG: type III polyketide synthase [Terriglobia bacterium]
MPNRIRTGKVSVVHPPNKVTTEVSRRYLQRWLESKGTSEQLISKLNSILDKTQIQSRYILLPPDEVLKQRDFHTTNSQYVKASIELGTRAAKEALELNQIHPSDVDMFISVSCTGFTIPGVDAHIMNRLGISSARTILTEHGCAGGTVGLIRAWEYCRAYPERTVLLLAHEFCSQTFLLNDLSMTNIVSSTLFGDGVAATVVSAKLNSPEPLPAIQRCATRFFPDTLHYMGFELRNEGLRIILSPEIPPFIKKNIEPTLSGFLESNRVKVGSIKHFVLHPGSIRIVEIIGKQLGLSPDKVEPTLNVLFNKGNMSSVTVLAVLQEIQRISSPRAGDLGLMAAFGPGFVAEMALMEWQEGPGD